MDSGSMYNGVKDLEIFRLKKSLKKKRESIPRESIPIMNQMMIILIIF